jgi:hypothetical protein
MGALELQLIIDSISMLNSLIEWFVRKHSYQQLIPNLNDTVWAEYADARKKFEEQLEDDMHHRNLQDNRKYYFFENTITISITYTTRATGCSNFTKPNVSDMSFPLKFKYVPSICTIRYSLNLRLFSLQLVHFWPSCMSNPKPHQSNLLLLFSSYIWPPQTTNQERQAIVSKPEMEINSREVKSVTCHVVSLIQRKLQVATILWSQMYPICPCFGNLTLFSRFVQ